MKLIQAEEKDLEVASNYEFKELDSLKEQLGPFKKYYDLLLEWTEFQAEIDIKPVKQLNPDEISGKSKKLNDVCRKLIVEIKNNKSLVRN